MSCLFDLARLGFGAVVINGIWECVSDELCPWLPFNI
jgi:hypothetical protein